MESPLRYWMEMLYSIAPFVLLIALWFLLARQLSNRAGSTKKNFIGPMQEMLQTVIVPEIRALRESVDALRADIKARDERPGQ